jgi:hypothetical protein
MDIFSYNKIVLVGSDLPEIKRYAAQLQEKHPEYELVSDYESILELNRAISTMGRRIIIMKEIELCHKIRQPNLIVCWVYRGYHDTGKRRLFLQYKDEIVAPTTIIVG